MKTLHTALSATALALMTLSAPAFAQGKGEPACMPVNEKEVSALFDRWNDSLRTLDPDKVTANYAQDGVLLPTVSNQPRTTPLEIRDYFVKFLQSEPQGKIDTRTIRLGCNVAQDMGTYTFRFKDGKTVQARYTYVYERVNGQWLIAHHHSSAMPETIAAATAK